MDDVGAHLSQCRAIDFPNEDGLTIASLCGRDPIDLGPTGGEALDLLGLGACEKKHNVWRAIFRRGFEFAGNDEGGIDVEFIARPPTLRSAVGASSQLNAVAG